VGVDAFTNEGRGRQWGNLGFWAEEETGGVHVSGKGMHMCGEAGCGGGHEGNVIQIFGWCACAGGFVVVGRVINDAE
jgi:hypothetical protein